MILTKKNIKAVNIDELIHQKAKDNKLEELLLIVPTNRRVRSYKRELIDQSPDKTSSVINLETLGTFSSRMLLESFGTQYGELDDAAAAVLLQQAFAETDLKYFSNYGDDIPTGTLERVGNVITEYKRHGIYPEHLNNEIKNLTGSEKIKAEDINSVYRLFNNKCEELNVVQQGDVYSKIISLGQKQFSKKVKELYPELNLIIVQGFDEFTSPEIELLELLSVTEKELFISFDYYKNNKSIFSHLDVSYNKLQQKGFREVNDTSPYLNNTFHKTVREEFFKVTKNEKSKDDRLFKLSALNPIREVELIAKEIKRLIIEEKKDPADICVAFNFIAEYSPLIRYVFSSYGIPFNLTDRFLLSNSPPVISLINLLEVAENNFYYKYIFRALGNSWITTGIEDTNALIKVAANLKIISGYQNWIDSVDSILIQINESSREDEDYDLLHKREYEKALEDIRHLNDLLEPFYAPMSVNQFVSNFNDLIKKVNLTENLLKYSDENLEKNVRAVSTFLNTIDEVFKLIKLEHGTRKKFPLSFYISNLKTAFEFNRYNIREKYSYGVLITTINEIRGLRFNTLFISGMVDGQIPTRYTPEIFMSGSFRKKQDFHLAEERYHFYQALCTWQEKLYLTYPKQSERKEFTQSVFLKEMGKFFVLNEVTEKDFSESAYSKKELLEFFGRNPDLKFEDNDEINTDYIKKAINIDDLRSKNYLAESPYTGFIYNDLSTEAKEALKSLRDEEYSAYQLQTYAKCPFQYFAERILKLDFIEEPAEEIEAREIGTLLHKILFRFYKKLKEENVQLKNADDKIFRKCEKLLFNIAEEEIEKLNLSELAFYESELIFGLDGNKEISILYKFLQTERNDSSGFVPEFFEIEFGRDSGKEIKADKVNLRGKIDRIDIDQENNLVSVVDYKLRGKKPPKPDVADNLALQLPLYLFAAKTIAEELVTTDLNYGPAKLYSLNIFGKNFGPKDYTSVSRKKMSDDEYSEAVTNIYEQIVEESVNAVNRFIENIASGIFPLTSLENYDQRACRYCDYQNICRIKEN